MFCGRLIAVYLQYVSMQSYKTRDWWQFAYSYVRSWAAQGSVWLCREPTQNTDDFIRNSTVKISKVTVHWIVNITGGAMHCTCTVFELRIRHHYSLQYMLHISYVICHMSYVKCILPVHLYWVLAVPSTGESKYLRLQYQYWYQKLQHASSNDVLLMYYR